MTTSEKRGGRPISAAPGFRVRADPAKGLRTDDWRLVASVCGISLRRLREWRKLPGFPVGDDGKVSVVGLVDWMRSKDPTE